MQARTRVNHWWSARSAVLAFRPCRNLPARKGRITDPTDTRSGPSPASFSVNQGGRLRPCAPRSRDRRSPRLVLIPKWSRRPVPRATSGPHPVAVARVRGRGSRMRGVGAWLGAEDRSPVHFPIWTIRRVNAAPAVTPPRERADGFATMIPSRTSSRPPSRETPERRVAAFSDQARPGPTHPNDTLISSPSNSLTMASG